MILDAFKLTGKTALITGAGKGIGEGITLAFAEMGANVICVARSQDDLEKVATKAREFGVEATAISCDVTKEEQLQALVDQVTEQYGKLDILINNAGAPGKGYGPMTEVTKSRFEHTLGINLTSVYALTQLCLPLLKTAESASIVNVSSALAWMVDRNFAAYAAAKAGVNQLTRVMAYELAPNIRVNGIAPGAVDTPATHFIKQNEAMHKATTRWIPLSRMGDPLDIALGALYLASPASGFVTGKIIDIDGGMAALPGSAIETTLAMNP
jgi:7-alpha-hydroxysteroid dehydrogenase